MTSSSQYHNQTCDKILNAVFKILCEHTKFAYICVVYEYLFSFSEKDHYKFAVSNYMNEIFTQQESL